MHKKTKLGYLERTETKMYENDMYEILVNEFGVSEESIQLVCNINGTSEETYRDILYAVSGYHDFDQLEDHEDFYN